MVPFRNRFSPEFGRKPRISGIRAKGMQLRNAYKNQFRDNIVYGFNRLSLNPQNPISIRKARNPKCFICQLLGHFERHCPSRQQVADPRDTNKVETVQTNKAEGYVQLYSDTIALTGDYLVKGTEFGTWNNIWYVSNT